MAVVSLFLKFNLSSLSLSLSLQSLSHSPVRSPAARLQCFPVDTVPQPGAAAGAEGAPETLRRIMATFVVIGAKGGTGREIVRKLLARPSSEVGEVRAVVRDPTTVPDTAFPVGDARLQVCRGDCTQTETLPLEGGVHTLFFAAAGKGYKMSKAVDRYGPRDVGKAAAAAGVGRFVLISSQLVDVSQGNRFSFIRGVLNTINTGLFHWKGMMDFKFEGEQYLMTSGVRSWTILRPGRLGDGAAGSQGALAIAQGSKGSFCSGSIIPRSDLGALAVEAALSERCANKILEVGTQKNAPAPTPGPGYLDHLFEALQDKVEQ